MQITLYINVICQCIYMYILLVYFYLYHLCIFSFHLIPVVEAISKAFATMAISPVGTSFFSHV